MSNNENLILERGLQSGSYTFFDRNLLASFAEHFYKTTGIPTSLHTFIKGSVELQAIHVGNNTHSSICSYLRQECFPRFRRACFDCNRIRRLESQNSEAPLIYRCHMDLCEAIIPLKRIRDEETVIYLGRVDTKNATEEGFKAFLSRAAKTEPLILENASIEELRRLYYAMPRMSEEQFAYATALAADYARLAESESRPIRYMPQSYTDSLKQFVDANIHLPITREMAADHVGISPGYLSHIISKELGCSFSEYVTAQKVDKAKELLTSSSLSIAMVAENCGYDNPKYFSTLFKKHTGMTAGEYRKKAALALDNTAEV